MIHSKKSCKPERHQVITRKRPRGGSDRRTANSPMFTALTGIFWPALLSTIALSVTGTMRWTSLMTIRSSLPPLLPIANAFSPSFHGIARGRGSNPLASFPGTTLTPDSFVQDEDVAVDTGTKQTLSISSSGSRSGVEVWDGVFSPEVCKELHELAVDHSERTTGEYSDDDGSDEDDSLEGSSIFVYRGHNRSPDEKLTPIEQALDSFLTAYYDRNESEDGKEQHRNRKIVVEYWCRQEHLNLEAHVDVDEVWFERKCAKNRHLSERFRYPTVGHVLYLTKPTLGVGPTCVFPPKAIDLAEGGPKQQNEDVSIRDQIDSVVTVPAVPGRVLRFPGSALHGVPKPVDVWLSQHTVDEEEEEDDDEDDYEVDAKGDDNYDDDCVDDEWDDDDDEERSVILFNTWEASADDTSDDPQIGPIGVRLDPMFHVDSDIGVVEMMMSSVDMGGVEVDEDFVNGMVQYARQQRNDQLHQWREKYCMDIGEDHKSDGGQNKRDTVPVYAKVLCEPSDSWKLTSIDAKPNDLDRYAVTKVGDKRTIRVPLMGDKLRRRHPSKAVSWTVPSSFENGVNEPLRPCEFPLTK